MNEFIDAIDTLNLNKASHPDVLETCQEKKNQITPPNFKQIS